MSIVNYFKTLIPSLEKRTILEDINNCVGELKTSTLPILKAAQKPMGQDSYKFKSQDIEAFSKKFKRDNRTGIKGNFIAVSYDVANRIEENSQTVIKLVEAMFSNGMVAGAITYRKASLLKYIEAMTFFQKYVRKLVHQTYILECNAVSDSSAAGGSLTEGEINWLKENEDAFIACLTGLSMKSALFMQAMEETPDAVVNPDTIDTVNLMAGGKTDPFKMNFISTNMNLIYHVRLRIAEYQHAKYEMSLQERKAIELRILHLQNKLDGKNDPKVEEQIQYNEARLEKLNYKIKKMEEAYE